MAKLKTKQYNVLNFENDLSDQQSWRTEFKRLSLPSGYKTDIHHWRWSTSESTLWQEQILASTERILYCRIVIRTAEIWVTLSTKLEESLFFAHSICMRKYQIIPSSGQATCRMRSKKRTVKLSQENGQDCPQELWYPNHLSKGAALAARQPQA